MRVKLGESLNHAFPGGMFLHKSLMQPSMINRIVVNLARAISKKIINATLRIT